MNKKLPVSTLTLFGVLALTACGGGPSAAPAPTVTKTVTAEPEPAPNVTVTVTAPAIAQAAAPPAAQPTPATAQIPTNVAGMNAHALDDDLRALGFKHMIYNSDTGKTVILLANWTVTGIDNAGTVQALNRDVVVHVTK